MLPLVGFLTMSAIWVVAWAGLTSPLGASLGNESPREILSVLPLHVVTRRPMDEFSPRVRTRLGRYKPEDDVSNETQRFFTEERMGKRSIALGRSGFRPGKRSDSLESHGLRPGRGSFDEIPDSRDLVYLKYEGKRSMAMGRMGFRPGKRSTRMRRSDLHPGKNIFVGHDESFLRPAKRSMTMDDVSFMQGKRPVTTGGLDSR
ncbi:hypothetical protein RB195_026291 [Necator americanus]|uniref:Uncharacterized protein n=1 Tax=Necator americanus TaxID=51031 RepID=A0ABR1EWS4_NECAM